MDLELVFSEDSVLHGHQPDDNRPSRAVQLKEIAQNLTKLSLQTCTSIYVQVIHLESSNFFLITDPSAVSASGGGKR